MRSAARRAARTALSAQRRAEHSSARPPGASSVQKYDGAFWDCSGVVWEAGRVTGSCQPRAAAGGGGRRQASPPTLPPLAHPRRGAVRRVEERRDAVCGGAGAKVSSGALGLARGAVPAGTGAARRCALLLALGWGSWSLGAFGSYWQHRVARGFFASVTTCRPCQAACCLNPGPSALPPAAALLLVHWARHDMSKLEARKQAEVRADGWGAP